MEKQNQSLPDITESVVINAAIDHVWDLISSGEQMAKWFMPSDMTPVEDTTFEMQTEFGLVPCEVTEVDPPHRLSFNWDKDGWTVTFLLKELNPMTTEFTVIHGGWQSADTILSRPNAPAGEIRKIMAGGWTGLVNKLKEVSEK